MSTTDDFKTDGYLRATIRLALMILLTIIILPQISAVPAIAENFYGAVIINGNPAPAGSDVVAFSQGKICGRYVVKIEGKYGFLNCNSNSLDGLYFEVNGKKAREDIVAKDNINLFIESAPYNLPKGSEVAMLIALIGIIAYLILKEKRRRA
jgi:hypothetical protein